MRFDETRAVWTVSTNKGDCIEARYCLMASGNLSMPRVPDFPGIERYRGKMVPLGSVAEGRRQLHRQTRRADRYRLLRRANVAKNCRPEASHVTVFQRTASFSVPARNGPIAERRRARSQGALPRTA